MNGKSVMKAGVSCAVVALVAGGLWAAGPRPQNGSAGGSYIEKQKARLEQDLATRIAEIERRFNEEASFRAKLKVQRVEFERKLAADRRAFLDSLQEKKPEERSQAWAAFSQAMRQKRDAFHAQRRVESKKFWEARMAGRSQGAAKVQ